jgi:L-lactate dehydrogenase
VEAFYGSNQLIRARGGSWNGQRWSDLRLCVALKGLAAEIVLIDVNRAKAEGEAMDLNRTEPFAYATRIWAGDYRDCAGAAMTVVTAGAAQHPGETRLDLVKRNAEIFGQIIPEVAKNNRMASS